MGNNRKMFNSWLPSKSSRNFCSRSSQAQHSYMFKIHFSISYNSMKIQICYHYWKIVDYVENSKKMTLKGRKHESRSSLFETKELFSRIYFFLCICRSYEDIIMDKINETPCIFKLILLYCKIKYSYNCNEYSTNTW